MAETTTETAPAPNEGKARKVNPISRFIRKNKTLSIVAGVGGLFALWKMRQGSGGEEGEPEGAAQVESYGESGGGNAELQAYEVGRAERREESATEEVEEMEDERRREREKNKEQGEEKEEGKTESPPGPESEAGPPPTSTTPSVSVHGRTFTGATSSRIAKAGQTTGGKAYVEYAIDFPGRVEHWQYFTATGNWRQVKNSAGGAAGNNGQAGGNQSGNPNAGGGSSGSGANAATSPPKPTPAPVAVAPAKPVTESAKARVEREHPNAVPTGNSCVNGGIGGHTPPKGYRLFCGADGQIWRAPK